MKKWRKYERLVAYLCSEEYSSSDTTVIPNARIIGNLSETERQIDVLIERRFDNDRTRRIVIDAKKYSKPLDIKDVEEFEGMLRDCSASRGILVCPNGYSDAAAKRAGQSIKIKLVPLAELDTLSLDSWEDCFSDTCSKRKNRGLILWDSPFGVSRAEGPLSIFCVAKCDECGDFHIWCWDCGEKFALGNEDEHKCGCDHDWFWLTAIEEDIDDETGNTLTSVYLLLPSLSDILIVDRKPLR